MSFNFDNFDDDENKDNPFKDLSKLFQHIQRDIIRSLQEGDFDNDSPNIKKFGFSIHMGPEGKPHISPINPNSSPQNKTPNNGFEEPFVDVFYDDKSNLYQIIAEVSGVENKDNVHLTVDDRDFTIHAESGPYKYKKSMLLKQPIDEKSIEFDLRNGVLEINAKSK